jgi:hypothetical protein
MVLEETRSFPKTLKEIEMPAKYHYNPYLNTDVDVDAPPEYSAVYDGDHLHVFYNDELVETQHVRVKPIVTLGLPAKDTRQPQAVVEKIANKIIERYIAEGEA